jgi:hypothetical protein
MSTPVREPVDDRKTELETVVSWPAVAAALGLALAGLAVAIVLGWLAATRAASGEDKPLAQRSTTAPREQAVMWPAPPVPWSQLRDTLPRPTAVEPPAPPQAVPQAPPHRLPAAEVRKPSAAPAVPAVVVTAPTPAEAAEEAKAPAVPSFKRRSLYSRHSESELVEVLRLATREVDLDTEKGTSAKLLDATKHAPRPEGREATAHGAKDAPQPLSRAQPILELLAQRADLKGLPVRKGAECQALAKEARAMQELSRELRSTMARFGQSSGSSVSYSEILRRDAELVRYLESLGKRAARQDDAVVRTWVQMFQAENAPVRLQLVKMLAAVKGDKAGAALAQRAVFDLAAEVREAAVKALKDRPHEEYRPVLLAGLRYPWAPAADHAAEALVNLDDREAVADLVGLLDQPDPQVPVQAKDKKWVAPELVRVNHLGNCLLCHAPSFDKDDPVRGLVPERDQPLPQLYYEQQRGTFVRADVTYLKQDFSVVQPVADHGRWPRLQRYDYLVRQRELSDQEAARLTPAEGAGADKPASYPQREAVLWALRELTGEDLGDKSADWNQFLLGQDG